MKKIQIINFINNEKLIKQKYIFIRKNKSKIKNILKQLFIPMIFGLSYYFYFLSLESCFDGEGPCTTYIDWIKKKVIQEIISCILLIMMIQLIILNKISKKHLVHIIIIFFFFYYYRHGIDFVDHGYFNFLFYCILVFVFTMSILPLDLMIICQKNANKTKILLLKIFPCRRIIKRIYKWINYDYRFRFFWIFFNFILFLFIYF